MPFWITLYADDMGVFEDSMQKLDILLGFLHKALQNRGMLMSTPQKKYTRLLQETAQ